jgi:hypothetical protein
MFNAVKSYVENLANVIKRQYPFLQIEIDIKEDALEIVFYNIQLENREADFILIVDTECIKFLKTNFEFEDLFEIQYDNSFELKLFLINFFFLYIKSNRDKDFFAFITFIFGEKIETFLDYLVYILKTNDIAFEKLLDNKIYIFDYGMIEQIASDKLRVTNQHTVSFRYINIAEENCTLFFSSVLSFIFDDLNKIKLFEDEEIMEDSEDNLDEDVQNTEDLNEGGFEGGFETPPAGGGGEAPEAPAETPPPEEGTV